MSNTESLVTLLTFFFKVSKENYSVSVFLSTVESFLHFHSLILILNQVHGAFLQTGCWNLKTRTEASLQ